MRLLVIILLLISLPGFPQRECLRKTYLSQIGVREHGNNRGKHVEKYLSAAGVKPGNPWCASFVYWCHKQCFPSINVPGAAMARSWYKKEKLVSIRNKTIKQPEPGDVVLFLYGETIYHAGFYDQDAGDFIITVEGNVRPGGIDGVHRIKRIKRSVYAIARWTEN
ncbi:MAG: CHAP domain-containing protein [Bacteroidales bacterium]